MRIHLTNRKKIILDGIIIFVGMGLVVFFIGGFIAGKVAGYRYEDFLYNFYIPFMTGFAICMLICMGDKKT